MIISPTFRAGALNGSVLRQGYLSTPGNHLLRPAIAVNAQGVGAIVFTVCPQQTVSASTTRSGLEAMMYSAESCG